MNTKQQKQKAQVVTSLSLAAMVMVLAYTFWHTGALLARYIAPGAIGYVAAAGIELGVIAMSVQFDMLKDSGRSWASKALFVFVFLATLTVSASANVAEGFRTSQGVELTSATFGQLDWLVAVIGVSATGLLSLIVMSLAELLGDSFATVLGIATDISKRGRQNSNTASGGDSLDVGRQRAIDNRRASKNLAMAQIVGILEQEPNISKAELAERVGKARSTVTNYLAELAETGVIEHNGRGVKVL